MAENTPIPCLALAYHWHLPPPDFKAFDVILVVARYETSIPNSGSINERSQAPATVRRYHAKLPPKPQIGRLSDVSGTLGLLFPIADERGERIASAFERLVADVLLWEMAEHEFGNERNILLLQGPLLHKLRGRLLYRGVSEKTALYSLTYNPRRFRAIEAAEQMEANLGEQGGLSPVYPPKGIDRATRS